MSGSVDRSIHRILTGTRELDRVLGDGQNDGVVQGSIVAVGGTAGQGKSTLLLQVGCDLADALEDPCRVLYVSGDESPETLVERAARTMKNGRPIPESIHFLKAQGFEDILMKVLDFDPDVIVLDSVQNTDFTEQEMYGFIKSRDITAFVAQFASKGVVLSDHLADVFLLLEGGDADTRTLSKLRDRFGLNERVGKLRVTPQGLQSVDN